MAGVALLIVVILIVVGVHSCQVSQTNSALRNYSDSVNALITQSNTTGSRFFSLLEQAGQSGATNAPSLQNQVDEARLSAESQLSRAQALGAPDQVKESQQNFVLTMRMRADGIGAIAQQLQPALQSQTSQNAVTAIAADMARFYASDAVYKDYTLPGIVTALSTAGIAVGGVNGEPVNQQQFLPNIKWLDPSYIAKVLHASTPASAKISTGPHAVALNSVSAGGTTLSTSSTKTLAASPPPTFTLALTNTGQNVENNVTCTVTVGGTSISGQATVPQAQPGQQSSCQVTLSSSPPAGSAMIAATIQLVPGEKNSANNTLVFPVNFQ